MSKLSLTVPPSQHVYYRSLVRWNLVDEIVFLTEPHEHPQVRDLIMQTLDHAVLEAALAELSPEEQAAFLKLCATQYHDESLLEWLEERNQVIRDILQQVIQETKQEIRQLLMDQV